MTDMENLVCRTESGLFVRQEEEGLLVYSPYSGLMFLVHPEDVKDTLSWLRRTSDNAPSEVVMNALGIGWDDRVSEGSFGATHYLGGKEKWDRYPWMKDFPILINWFLTGNCQLACKYCDASDLMRNVRPEPSARDLKRIAASILSYHPLAVVLTGGEPLLSPHIEECIRLLHEHTGVIVDTNGVLLDSSRVSLFKRYQVVVRVSLDSPLPHYNDDLRRFSENESVVGRGGELSSLQSALKALCLCLDEGIPVSVQTVATKRTINDLPAFGDRLYRLGVRFWRVHLVSLSRDNPNYEALTVPAKSCHNTVSKLLRVRHRWEGMDFQVLDDANRNAVVIVSTDGEFLTESNTGKGKIAIDRESPRLPAPERVFLVVSREAHARRYLGGSSIQSERWSNG